MKKPIIRNILVPIDFSEMSIQAIETAKGLARKFEASVHLAHVHEFYYPSGFMAPSGQVALPLITYHDNSVARLSRDLKSLAKRYDLPAENCQVLSGLSTFHEICDLARKLPIDLIVMPTHGYTGIDHFFEGSTAERIVQHSPCPVFVVREKKRPSKTRPRLSINTILVPVDFSSCSRVSLRYAIEFAGECGARVILLHATYLGYIYPSPGYDVHAVQEAARKGAERQMKELVRGTKFGGVRFEAVFTSGSPVLDVCAFAQNHDVDVIITSTHGRTGFKHVLIGSIAENIVRHANRPVLVVPSHPEVRAARLTRENRSARPRIVKQTKSPASLTKRNRKLSANSFPERRNTNKFRESHSR